jgi:RPA family protein
MQPESTFEVAAALMERMTGVRASVEDVIKGKFTGGNRPNVVSPYGVEIRRVVLVGFVVQHYTKSGEYSSITIDDGTETIRVIAPHENPFLLVSVEPKSLVMVVGKVRESDGEVHIDPEIVRKLADPNFITLHRLERYRAILTLSGISNLGATESADRTQATETDVQTTIEETSPPSPDSISISGTISKQIIQFVKQMGPTGVKIQDIIEFFEERGQSKTDIQMKVLDLQDQEKIVEIELGKYVIGGK